MNRPFMTGSRVRGCVDRVGATLRCHVTDRGQTWGVTVNVTEAQGTIMKFDFLVDKQPGL
jgi:hypothetical protein